MQPQQDAFQDPRAMGEPGPAMSELAGRVVAIVVKSYDPTATYAAPGDKEGPKSRPSVFGDLYVFGGPDQPLNYGGSDSQTDPKPPTHTIGTPAVFKGRYFSGVNVVSALRDAAPIVMGPGGVQTPGPGNGGPVIGIVEKSTFGGKPWNLTKLNPQDEHRGAQFLAMRQAAGQFWGQAQAGLAAWFNHADHGQPIPGQGAPVAGANPYGQAAQAAPYGNWPQGAAPVNPQNPAQQAWGQGVATAPQQAAPAMDPQYAAFLAQQAQAAAVAATPPVPQAPPVDPQYAAWLASQGQGPAVTGAPYVPAQAAPPAVEMTDAPVPGFEAIWSTLQPAQKDVIRAQAAAGAGQGAQVPGRVNPY